MLLTLPAAVALAVSAEPIVRVLFERGAFTSNDTLATAAAVRAIAFGLPAFVILKVLQPAFFARGHAHAAALRGHQHGDRRRGRREFVFIFAWLGWRPYVGIPIATALAGWANALLLWRALGFGERFAADHAAVARHSLHRRGERGDGRRPGMERSVLAHLHLPGQGCSRRGSLALLLGAGATLYAAVIVGTGVLRPVQVGRFLGR